MNTDSEPIRVVLTRDSVESVHIVDAVVTDGQTRLESWGNEGAAVIPRSAIKFIQAIPLVRSGAADEFGVSDIELTLAAASHSGEPDHVEAVASWLGRIGSSPSDLECGDDRPINRSSADQLLADHQPFTALHNCCSGKHTGFMTLARHIGVDPAGYIARDHPVQMMVTETISQFTDVDLAGATNGLDGCGIPTFALPLERLALAMARFARPDCVDDASRDAVLTLQRAIAPNAWWLAGTGRAEVDLGAEASSTALLKGGAEGVFLGALPESGLGIALKARDGASRGADAAMAAVLEHLGMLSAGRSRTEIANKAGTVVGEMYVELG